MADLDTKKIRACSPLLEAPASGVVVELCDEIDTLRARVKELEAKLKVAEEALLLGARSAEALKRPCGMDPETPQALRNGKYMSISLNLRAALAKIKEPS